MNEDPVQAGGLVPCREVNDMATEAGWGMHATDDQFERWSKQHYENFTVGSPFLPSHLRRPIRILYAYCRYVDDLGDEASGDRLSLLDAWEADFRCCYGGQPQHPILRALHPIIDAFNLPPEPFLKLIEANRMDQRLK